AVGLGDQDDVVAVVVAIAGDALVEMVRVPVGDDRGTPAEGVVTVAGDGTVGQPHRQQGAGVIVDVRGTPLHVAAGCLDLLDQLVEVVILVAGDGVPRVGLAQQVVLGVILVRRRPGVGGGQRFDGAHQAVALVVVLFGPDPQRVLGQHRVGRGHVDDGRDL